MKCFNNILVSVDTRIESHPALEWASLLAEQNGAKLKIVNVLPEFAWHVRLMMRDHDHVRELLLKENSEKLEALAAPLRQKGIDASTKTFSGETSVETIREVLRDQHDLVVRVSKGPHSRRSGFFGTTSTRLLRKCPCPVWIVRPDATPQFDHVLAAVDPTPHDEPHAELNNSIIKLADAIRQFQQGRLSVVHVWSLYGENILRSKMPQEEYSELEKTNHAEVERAFDKLLSAHGKSVRDEGVHLIKGDAASAIVQLVQQSDVDLLVMGTVARGGLSGLMIGNTAELILSRVQCSVLALKPADFASPIKPA